MVRFPIKDLDSTGEMFTGFVRQPGVDYKLVIESMPYRMKQVCFFDSIPSNQVINLKGKIDKPFDFKWYDIYLNGRKLGGILIENIFSDNKYIKTIIGIGLNINDDVKIDNSICIRIDQDRESIIDDIYFFIKEVNGFDKEKINEMYDKELI
jgi:biotin-(acetyl-CoA carboxylase) ligase